MRKILDKLEAKQTRVIFIIVLLSLLLPLIYSFYHQIEPIVDARAYDRIAVNIVEGNGFREYAEGDLVDDISILRAGPVYEYFLAGSYAIFGRIFEAIWILQALLHALTTYLVFLIGSKFIEHRGALVGMVAAILFGLHPDLIEISAMVMTETVYLFLVVLTVYLFGRSYKSPDSQITVAMLSLSTGLAILARPPVLLFIPIIMLFYFIKKKWRSLAVFIVLTILVLTPWTMRNQEIFDDFIPTTLIGEYNIWIGNTLLSNGGQIAGGPNPATEYSDEFGFADFKSKATGEALSFISEYPGKFISLTATRVVRYFSLIRPMGFWFYQSGLPQGIFILSSLLAIALLFITGFAGLFIGARDKDHFVRFLALFAVSAPLLIIFATVESRYRFQIYPFLALLAGFLLAKLTESPNREILKRSLVPVLFLVGISVIDLFLFSETVIEHLERLI